MLNPKEEERGHHSVIQEKACAMDKIDGDMNRQGIQGSLRGFGKKTRPCVQKKEAGL